MTVFASIAIMPTTAQARDDPFCIKGEFWPSTGGDCSFGTYQHCLAEASGRGGAYCDANSRTNGPGGPAERRYDFAGVLPREIVFMVPMQKPGKPGTVINVIYSGNFIMYCDAR
ncbi:DUF3551 domain-containing protein [Bradyrhizobium australiense]|uniref:DUF3551 domain-containing protein n=1 Tax=Bradyrhizobium australiense TaxID=2721161 RepID=A0A7Y4LU79_9BRAD|nr:DUF3551 domain-containing protein [Bradyrhizobium australiense]NOJ38806.1 DUF3551 domain-containing protein [Bradyrhizobium australiense]